MTKLKSPKLHVNFCNPADCLVQLFQWFCWRYAVFLLLLSIALFFLAPYRTKCPKDQILIGQGVLMMQKQKDTRLAENKLCGCGQDMKSWSWHHMISPRTAAREWFLITALLSVQLYSLQSIMCFDCATYSCSLQPKLGVAVVWMHLSTCLCFVLTWSLSLVGK